MNLEDTLSETSQLHKENAIWFHLYAVPKAVKLIETEGSCEVLYGGA
jgi:hypothetical protein